MKIYLAAPWVDRNAMPECASLLEKDGHTITHKWWAVEAAPYNERTDLQRQGHALQDVNGVAEADVVLLVNSGKSEGKAVEQGIAIALGIPIIGIGIAGEHSKNIFHWLSIYTWVKTFHEAQELLLDDLWLESNNLLEPALYGDSIL